MGEGEVNSETVTKTDEQDRKVGQRAEGGGGVWAVEDGNGRADEAMPGIARLSRITWHKRRCAAAKATHMALL